MGDQTVVLAVASYPSRRSAEVDFRGLWPPKDNGRVEQLAAAMVQKGANGWLEMTRSHSAAMSPAFGAAVLGSVITVLAAPLGVSFLASVMATRAEWEGTAALIGRFWHEVPRDLLRTMGNLLEAGPTSLVFVAIDHRVEHVTPMFSNATTNIVTDRVRADLAVDFAKATAATGPGSPTPSPAVEDAGGASPLL
jgi:hypothetical protein